METTCEVVQVVHVVVYNLKDNLNNSDNGDNFYVVQVVHVVVQDIRRQQKQRGQLAMLYGLCSLSWIILGRQPKQPGQLRYCTNRMIVTDETHKTPRDSNIVCIFVTKLR